MQNAPQKSYMQIKVAARTFETVNTDEMQHINATNNTPETMGRAYCPV